MNQIISIRKTPAVIATTDRESIRVLQEMLQYRRPRGGETEREFLNKFLWPLGGMHEDGAGNISCVVGGDNPTILWSCHTDSVHRNEGLQSVEIDGNFATLGRGAKSNCLGADDAAGVWIMREMILAAVPGLYVFHYGEESGCIGSSWIAKENRPFLEGISAAIAFDRRGTSSVITHQTGGRCCSDAFGQSIADQLPDYKLDANGIYTDTASYTSLVPECTNLSVGYYNEHSSDEILDLSHMATLRRAMLDFDPGKLVIERDPTKVDKQWWEERNDDSWVSYRDHSSGRSKGYGKGFSEGTFDELEDDRGGYAYYRDLFSGSLPHNMADLLHRYPESCAEVFANYGFTVDDLWDEIDRLHGDNKR